MGVSWLTNSQGDPNTLMFQSAGESPTVWLVKLHQLDQVSKSCLTIIQSVEQLPFIVHLKCTMQTHTFIGGNNTETNLMQSMTTVTSRIKLKLLILVQSVSYIIGSFFSIYSSTRSELFYFVFILQYMIMASYIQLWSHIDLLWAKRTRSPRDNPYVRVKLDYVKRNMRGRYPKSSIPSITDFWMCEAEKR